MPKPQWWMVDNLLHVMLGPFLVLMYKHLRIIKIKGQILQEMLLRYNLEFLINVLGTVLSLGKMAFSLRKLSRLS
jgi:hypothetical protein